jgi:hypothetical protein
MTIATNAYVAKRAIFDRFSELAADGQLLAGIQVSYEYPRQVERELVYGGGVKFQQSDDAEDGEHDILSYEQAAVGVYIRVTGPSMDVREADARCEEIAGLLAATLKSKPRLTPAIAYSRIISGQGDYHRGPAPISILALEVNIISYLA